MATEKAETKTEAEQTNDKPRIGTVADAINPKAAATEPIKEHKERKQNQKDAPITTLAQLRDWHLARNSEPSAEELEKVRALEAKVAEEGADKARKPASETK